MKVLKPGYYSVVKDGDCWFINPEDRTNSIFIGPKTSKEVSDIFGESFCVAILLDDSNKNEFRLKLDLPHKL